MTQHSDFEWINPKAVAREIRAKWLLYFLVALLGVGTAVLRFFLTDTVYKASATLIPNFTQESKLSKLESIASKFGMESPVPGINLAQYLEHIVTSRTLLLNLCDYKVVTPKGDSTTLFQFLKPEKSPAPQVDTLAYLKKLQDLIRFQKEASGLVQIEVKAATPKMAAGIANQLTIEIDQFARDKNLQTLKNQITYLTEQVAVTETRRKKPMKTWWGSSRKTAASIPSSRPRFSRSTRISKCRWTFPTSVTCCCAKSWNRPKSTCSRRSRS